MSKTIAALALLLLGTVYGARAIATCEALNANRVSAIDARVAANLR